MIVAEENVMGMVRKQLYLTRDQDSKLKRLAEARGCTEAEVVRGLVEGAEEADERDAFRAQLLAAGFKLSPRRRVSQEEHQRIRRAWEEANERDPGPLGLLDALLEERESGW